MAGKPQQDVVVAEILQKEAAVAEMLPYNLVWVVQANRFQFMRKSVKMLESPAFYCGLFVCLASVCYLVKNHTPK